MEELRRSVGNHGVKHKHTRHELLQQLPSYARVQDDRFPQWKIDFIRRNREWFQKYRGYFPGDWLQTLKGLPACMRKLEWNCQGEPRDLWKHVLQFRPSGLRVKRYTSSPSLVAMTATQIPILGPKKRFLTRVEGRRLQGFPDTHRLPRSREKAFQALGNAVHVGVVEAVAGHLLKGG